MPPIAAKAAAAESLKQVAAELARGAPDFSMASGQEPFDVCLGLLGYPKAGISTLLHCFSLNWDVEHLTAVPRYKSVLVTVELSSWVQTNSGDANKSATATAHSNHNQKQVRTLRILLMDLGALVAPVQQMGFWCVIWRYFHFTVTANLCHSHTIVCTIRRHGDYSTIEHIAAEV